MPLKITCMRSTVKKLWVLERGHMPSFSPPFKTFRPFVMPHCCGLVITRLLLNTRSPLISMSNYYLMSCLLSLSPLLASLFLCASFTFLFVFFTFLFPHFPLLLFLKTFTHLPLHSLSHSSFLFTSLVPLFSPLLLPPITLPLLTFSCLLFLLLSPPLLPSLSSSFPSLPPPPHFLLPSHFLQPPLPPPLPPVLPLPTTLTSSCPSLRHISLSTLPIFLGLPSFSLSLRLC